MNTFQGNIVTAKLDGKVIIQMKVDAVPSRNGFVALGTENFAKAHFDNLKISKSSLLKVISNALSNYIAKWENRVHSRVNDLL